LKWQEFLFMLNEDKKKVVVGISGGVDSAVAAAVLKREGFDVTGVFLRLWKKEKGIALADEEAAREVAKKIGVKFRAVSARRLFQKTVIDNFLQEYARGRTPNPCVFCNENLKFKLLFKEAKKVGASWVATGHYARIEKSQKNEKYKLLSGKDQNKNQAYFLYRLKQKDLARLIFPLGERKKEEVKKAAKEMNLPVWEKKESQDVCFLAGTNVSDFLQHNLKARPGEIVNEKKEIVGRHEGLFFYTYGQRKGIEIGGIGPYYVFGKDFSKNQLLVTNDASQLSLFSKVAQIEKVNWIGDAPSDSQNVWAETRYRNPLVRAIIKKKEKGGWEVFFEKPQRAVTPGQSIVFFGEDGEVLGGGIVR
jgi:tRNA-uridine 2-sulfurtransferase